MRKRKIAILLCMSLIIAFSSPAFAYNLENHYLNNMACTYKWGSNMSSTSILKTGWQDAISEWNSEGAYITNSVSSQNILQSAYDNTKSYYGISFIVPYDDQNYSAVWYFTCQMNSAKSGWNANVAQSVGVHELGHVIGLAHNSVTYSIMNESRNRNNIYTVQNDDRNGVNAIYN
ncbi:MAG: matrixin family metalloprotease [Firmicutes bacterium]|nr:matrixin family metalloprotease [Bacillota bacterium]MBQ6013990.1 matrixin family metalloprotease [Bacillota bacterium]MBQ6261460.1 matrixin family metalloprotease [Bacillota bacterium]MBR0113817.1 matrixin family metalloprotease [Bacillota bacterium]MBR0440396.1 matrixin family metalloprotease [Bacillota bacterium]